MKLLAMWPDFVICKVVEGEIRGLIMRAKIFAVAFSMACIVGSIGAHVKQL